MRNVLLDANLLIGVFDTHDSFDIFHFAAAKYYALEIETFDGDFEQLERLYADYRQETAA